MPEHVVIPCEHCRRGLRVRVEYLGQRVGCNYCGHSFVARRTEDSEATPTSPSLPVQPPQSRTAEPLDIVARDQELERLREEVLRLKTEHDDIAAKFLEASNQRISLHLRAENLEKQLSQALEHLRLAQDEIVSRQASQSELDRLRVESEALHERATHAVRLEEELQERAANALRLEDVLRERTTHACKLEEELQALLLKDEQRRLEFDESVALNARLQEQVESLAAGLGQSHRDELDRLDAEVVALRASLDAQRTESEERLGRLTEERDLAVSERDRLGRELETLVAGLKTAREEIHGLAKELAEIALEGVRLEDEREAVARSRSELQSLIKEREHALEEQVAGVVQTRERLEFERASLQTRCDRERQEGLIEFQKLAQELASVRGDRDELIQTLQATRREFEAFKNRRLDENEAQYHREQGLRSMIDQLQANQGLLDQGSHAQACDNEESRALRAELETRRLEAEENVNHHREAIQALRQEWLEERNAWYAKANAAELEARSLRTEVERLQHEVELEKTGQGAARAQFAEERSDHTRLIARFEELESRSKQAAERDRKEIERLTLRLAEAVRYGKSDETWIAGLTQRVDTTAAEGRKVPVGKGATTELPPRPRFGPGQDQDAFQAALQEWMNHAQRRRNQATASLTLLEGELQSAREQLLLLHRDLALGDWDDDDDDDSITFPFGEE